MAEQDVLKLVGLSLGRSKEPAKLRLYLTRNFSRYFEFSKEDTLHSERSSTGGVIAWLTPGAQVVEMTMPASVPMKMDAFATRNCVVGRRLVSVIATAGKVRNLVDTLHAIHVENVRQRHDAQHRANVGSTHHRQYRVSGRPHARESESQGMIAVDVG